MSQLVSRGRQMGSCELLFLAFPKDKRIFARTKKSVKSNKTLVLVDKEANKSGRSDRNINFQLNCVCSSSDAPDITPRRRDFRTALSAVS